MRMIQVEKKGLLRICNILEWMEGIGVGRRSETSFHGRERILRMMHKANEEGSFVRVEEWMGDMHGVMDDPHTKDIQGRRLGKSCEGIQELRSHCLTRKGKVGQNFQRDGPSETVAEDAIAGASQRGGYADLEEEGLKDGRNPSVPRPMDCGRLLSHRGFQAKVKKLDEETKSKVHFQQVWLLVKVSSTPIPVTMRLKVGLLCFEVPIWVKRRPKFTPTENVTEVVEQPEPKCAKSV
ncbi:hypothetical protein F0562_024295 [Nyssa sinensis]|uniref:Uncharacterized protein n=1 Tax=Nyssa sinensis TaxID=561372 RepID=A0A5J5BGC0_9ASTE|nr:hypothetical protein F0562_024295 [Nyssa sinensis]